MILYYSTVTGDYYSTIAEGVEAEHKHASKYAEQIDKLSRTLRKYNREVDSLRKQYEREIASQLNELFK